MGWDDSDEDDWEKAGDAVITAASTKKGWSDEDVSSDEGEVRKQPIQLPPTEGSGKKKRSLKQILKEREEKEARRRAEIAALEEEEEELTPAEKKAREQEQIVAADLQNAEDLFADTRVTDKVADEDDPLHLTPTNPKDFKLYGDALVKHLTSLQKVQGYSLFLERLLKGVATDLSIDECNALMSVLKVQVNSKQQEQRKKDGKTKKSKKPSLMKAHDVTDDGTYNEYDDFM